MQPSLAVQLIHCQYSTTKHISCRCSLLLNCQYLTAIHWACFVPIFFAYTLPIFWYMLCVFLAFTLLPTIYCLYISSNSTYIGNILCSHNISVLCVDGLHNAYSQLLQILDLNIFEDRPCFPQITHKEEDKTWFGWEWILSQTRPSSKLIVKVLNPNLNFILDLILDLLLPDYWSCRRYSSESAVQSLVM